MPEHIAQLNLPEFPPLPEAVTAELQLCDMVHVVAPTWLGKTTHIDELAHDPQFGSIKSFMTRPPKPGESATAAHFLGDTDATRQTLRAQAAAGKIMNITQHPTTGYIYGTYLSEFAFVYNLMPTLTQTIAGFRQRPFRRQTTLCLSTAADAWTDRLLARGAEGKSIALDLLKRLPEAASCLDWGLSDPEAYWLSTVPGAIEANARHMKHVITTGERQDETLARQEAMAMRSSIPRLTEQLREMTA